MLHEPRAPTEFRRVSPRFWMARQTVIALVFAPLLGGALAGMAALGGGGWVLLPVGVAVVAVLQWALELGRYRTWGYAEREDDLIVRRGLMFRRVSVVPYGRMQLIDVTAGPVDRAFGLATVQLHTAAAATDARIPFVPDVEAARLRDRLTALGEAHAAGL